MTNQQGAPEALYAAAMEFAAEKASISYVQRKCRCSWNDAEKMLERMVREGIIATYGGRKSAALVEAQQPAAHVQNHAEIEHVAGDVSKNGPESNMAQQPAPSAAADLHPKTADLVQRFAAALADKLAAAEKKYGYSDGWASPDWMDECRLCLREHLFKGDPRDVAAYCAFLWHHGESTALPSEVVEDRVKEFEQLFPAPKPSPTPQADSQPASVMDSVADDLEDRAKRCDAPGNELYVLGLREAVSAIRAARATADSVTAPADGVVGPEGRCAHYLPCECAPEAREGCVSWRKRKHTPPAQAADSVLEDAARLDWLALAGPTSICVVVDRRHDGEVEVATDDVTGYGKTLREALDAARKQGGAT